MSYTNKTQPTKISPEKYIKQAGKLKEKTQNEALVLVDLYTRVTGSPCIMWGKIFGFGRYHYLDSRGGEHVHLIAGFAFSSIGFTLYNMVGWEAYKKDIEKLGKFKISGKSCLAIKSIDEINLGVLQRVVAQSVVEMKKRYKTEV